MLGSSTFQSITAENRNVCREQRHFFEREKINWKPLLHPHSTSEPWLLSLEANRPYDDSAK